MRGAQQFRAAADRAHRKAETQTPCPVCHEPDCHYWQLRQTETWHPAPKPKFRPLKPVPPGTLKPCGENSTGSVVEFFANSEDIPDLIANGITTRIDGVPVHFAVRLTGTPHYMNGDVQIQARRT